MLCQLMLTNVVSHLELLFWINDQKVQNVSLAAVLCKNSESGTERVVLLLLLVELDSAVQYED